MQSFRYWSCRISASKPQLSVLSLEFTLVLLKSSKDINFLVNEKLEGQQKLRNLIGT
jgi:hypothetical protein